MARTTQMRLVELMVLKEDISRVLEFIGKKKNFEFQSRLGETPTSGTTPSKDLFEKLAKLDECAAFFKNFNSPEDI